MKGWMGKVISNVSAHKCFKRSWNTCAYKLVGGWKRPLGRHEKLSVSIYRTVKLAEWATFLEIMYTMGGQGGNRSKSNYSTIR